MNNEETKILAPNENEEVKETKNSQKKNASGKPTAYAVGGYAAGVASGVAGSSFAATPHAEIEEVLSVDETLTDETVQETVAEVKEKPVMPAPNPEEVLLATDEGVRIAQVNDDVSFSEAFADARRQVGAGGVFEWRGHVYGTYYEDEWNNMSTDERAQYQAKIDYQAVMGESTESVPVASKSEEVLMASNVEMVDEQSVQTNIKILGVEAVVDQQGNPMTVAAVEVEGVQSVLVDVDNDGTMDVIMVDEDQNGQISENEIYDVSNAHITTDDLQQHIATTQNPGMMMACNDDMPDYVNDADISSMA